MAASDLVNPKPRQRLSLLGDEYCSLGIGGALLRHPAQVTQYVQNSLNAVGISRPAIEPAALNLLTTAIHGVEHHGLNRCSDKGLAGYKRYVGLGVLAYNLHRIGARVLAAQGAWGKAEAGLKSAA